VKKDKKRVFTVNLKHDGIFSPFSYINGDETQLTDFNFEGMSYDNLRELVRKLVHAPVNSLYYYKVGKTLKQGLCSLKNDADVQGFLKVGYESKWVVDLYVELYGYDAMDFKISDAKDYESPNSSDAYCSSDDEEVIDYVDFLSCGRAECFINEPIPVTEDLHMEDPDSSSLEPRHQIQRGIAYPRHDPLQPWNEMQPILGMRYDHPEQLKLALANYRVAGRYQLWFQKNDWRQLLVFCGRDVSKGRCAGYHSKKVKANKQLFTESNDDAKKGIKANKKTVKKKGNVTFKVGKVKTRSCKLGEGTSKDGEGSSRNSDVSPKWTKSKIASSRKSSQPQCGFRLWASWMGSENSFQIKSLKAEHKCAINYNLGSLVTYKWIAHHFAKEIIEDPFIPLLKIKAAIREKFLINVSLGQCKRAKRRALYIFEGGLIEHYGRLWEYRQAILDTNPGSTCIVDKEETEYGNTYFRIFYICFKGVKDGWKAGCGRVIGCTLIAWEVVKVENNENWCWFLSLLQEDLELGHETGITVISDSHKGLLDAVSDWLPNAEHKWCTRHVFANFKNKFNRVQLQRLFWLAAGTKVESIFYNNIDQIKAILPDAYDYLVQRNPNSWSRSFFDLNSKCASFENGIVESFNRAILVQRTKPIITMLEDIRLYIMQRPVQMKIISINLEDKITPFTRKRLEVMKKKQRLWTVVPSGFQELEVRKGEESFGVNLHLKKCMCKLWELLGIPCVHFVAAYLFLNKEPNEGVDQCYSQERWFEAYQYSIKPGGRGDTSGDRGKASGGIGEASGGIGEASDGRGRARGKGGRSGRARWRCGRGQDRGGRGRERGGTKESASTRVEDGTAYVQTQESVADRGEPSWRLNEDAPGATVEGVSRRNRKNQNRTEKTDRN
ncbi:calcium/proton exchanger, partial [Tanacetum coccineum]